MASLACQPYFSRAEYGWHARLAEQTSTTDTKVAKRKRCVCVLELNYYYDRGDTLILPYVAGNGMY